VLGGADGAKHDIVVANAGAALYVAGLASSIRDGVQLAKQAIASGSAAAKLQELVKESNA
jgi:anthranilate phosphoribosyltransferase